MLAVDNNFSVHYSGWQLLFSLCWYSCPESPPTLVLLAAVCRSAARFRCEDQQAPWLETITILWLKTLLTKIRSAERWTFLPGFFQAFRSTFLMNFSWRRHSWTSTSNAALVNRSGCVDDLGPEKTCWSCVYWIITRSFQQRLILQADIFSSSSEVLKLIQQHQKHHHPSSMHLIKIFYDIFCFWIIQTNDI